MLSKSGYDRLVDANRKEKQIDFNRKDFWLYDQCSWQGVLQGGLQEGDLWSKGCYEAQSMVVSCTMTWSSPVLRMGSSHWMFKKTNISATSLVYETDKTPVKIVRQNYKKLPFLNHHLVISEREKVGWLCFLCLNTVRRTAAVCSTDPVPRTRIIVTSCSDLASRCWQP